MTAFWWMVGGSMSVALGMLAGTLHGVLHKRADATSKLAEADLCRAKAELLMEERLARD